MIEVEIKIRANLDEVEKKLINNGFSLDTPVRETDMYFDNTTGDIRGNDTALRIRTVEYPESDSSMSFITFKGKRCDDVSMTRPEYETSVEHPAEMIKILESLGYKPVEPIVIKARTVYVNGSITACLDRVEGLGDFLELEIITGKDTKNDALDRLWTMLEALGYNRDDTTTVSYLTMLQNRS